MNSSEPLELEDFSGTEFETPSFILEQERRRTLMISTYSVLIVVATIGNVAVIYNLIRLKMLKGRLTGVDKLVLNLAVADLFVAFLALPHMIVQSATSSWELGNFFCKTLSFFNPFGVYLSGFTVACISLERYLAVASSAVNCPKEGRRVKIMISLTWIAAIIASFPQILIYNVHEFVPNIKACVTTGAFSSQAAHTAYSMAGLVLYHSVPLVAIVTCYSAILVRLRRRKKHTPSSCRAMVNRLSSNVFRMSLVISLTFFLCWAPYCIVTLWYFIDRVSMYQLLPMNTMLLLFAFGYTNACSNPIVYGFFQLRKREERRHNESEDENLADKTVVWSELNLNENET